MTEQRWEAIELLQATRDEFAVRVDDIAERLWHLVPATGGWSLAQVAEHVTLVEVSTGKLIARKLFVEPAPEDVLAETRGNEAKLLGRVLDRTTRLEAPEFVSPKGRWPTRAELVSAFLTSREMVIIQLSDPTRDLRRYAAPHPLIGPLDGYQWGMFLSLHLQRHLVQMEEILRAVSKTQ
jgi:hypothetical protein